MFSSDLEAVPTLTPKALQTRTRIRDAAIASFIERGYADTTIRLIASEVGVSVGSAYYYFPTKTHLVQELYEQVQHDHLAAATPLLTAESDLVERLRIVFETGFATLRPYHRVGRGFLGAMIAPDSPINPLAGASTAARDMTIELFRTAVTGASHRLPADIADALPQALFVAYLGLTLRWTYDRSHQQRSTAALLTTTLKLLAIALPFTRMPGVHGIARTLLEQIGEVRA